jgi:hypothetical protein
MPIAVSIGIFRSTAKLAIELMKKGSHGKLNLPNKKNHENPTRILH